jgi:stage V sporulation protein B
VGVFVAAHNIARVPSMVLMTVATVILPSISKAVAANDEALARRYIHQALRFICILYLPMCLVFMAQPEEMLQFVYSKDFSGGGIIFGLLVVGEGLQTVHAILGTVLTAAGQARKAALVTCASIVPSVGMLVFLIHVSGATGAALSNALSTLISGLFLGVFAWKRFGSLMNERSVRNIVIASGIMFLVFGMFAQLDSFLLPCGAGLAAYGVTLVALREIKREDLALIPWLRLQRSTAARR